MKKQIQKGFTLIELIVVIAVLAILAGVAVPKFIDVTAKAKQAAEAADVGTIRAGLANYAAGQAVGTGTTPGTGTLTYPAAADLTIDAVGTAQGKAFALILEANSAHDLFERGWKAGTAAGTFVGPNGGIYTYTATGTNAGSFVKTGGN